jgi:hypothetical protein
VFTFDQNRCSRSAEYAGVQISVIS